VTKAVRYLLCTNAFRMTVEAVWCWLVKWKQTVLALKAGCRSPPRSATQLCLFDGSIAGFLFHFSETPYLCEMHIKPRDFANSSKSPCLLLENIQNTDIRQNKSLIVDKLFKDCGRTVPSTISNVLCRKFGRKILAFRRSFT
jgi:hypothetical protein